MSFAESDVVVIGGGVIGCAVAYYLAKQGTSVTIVERERVGSGASSVNSGVISMATKRPGRTLDLAMASQRLYQGLAVELGADLDYQVTGSLIIAESETEAGFVEDLARQQRAAGVTAEIVSAQRCRELNPLLEGRLLSGVYCPTDAQVDPFKVTQAYARAAQNRGVRILSGTAVHGIETRNGRVANIATSRGTIVARCVVNAAGAWADAVGAMIGVRHDVKPRRGQCVILEAVEDMPPVRVSGASQLLAKHAAAESDGNPHVSFSYTARPASGTTMLGSTNEFVGFDTATTRAGLAGICQAAAALMPRLARLHAVRAWAGLRPYCASGPLLGRVGGPEGYAVATGHGGDGVALAPITGAYVAEVIARDGAECELGAFLVARR